MKIFDSHVHIGDEKSAKEIIKNSISKNKYRLYSSINCEVINETQNFLNNVDGYFAIPIIFKENSIAESNMYLKEYCKKNLNALEVPLIEDDLEYDKCTSLIYKEHFLLHDYNFFEKREKCYTFLNDTNGFLLLHCKDKIRLEYISELVKRYPRMNIIVAHLGRNVFEDFSFSKNIIDTFYNYENVLFDTSTITNNSILLYALHRCGAGKILFGTDFPYEKPSGSKIGDYYIKIMNLKISDNEKEKILYENASKIKKYCKTLR